MKLRSVVWITAFAIVAAPLSAHASGCGKWNRLPEQKKWDRIDRMIDDAISGPKGRSYQVNRNAIGRCLQANSENMLWDFNDLCGDPSTAHKSAIPTRFKWYIWNCVN